MSTDKLKSQAIEFAKTILPYGLVIKLQQSVFNTSTVFSPPPVYNRSGEEMHLFYLQDDTCKMQPYGFVAGAYPQHILWDRFNQTLETQFYTHAQVKKLSAHTPKKRFAYFIESEALVPDSYDILLRDKGLAKEFTAIFTTSDRHLQTLENATFCPAAGIWYGVGDTTGLVTPNRWQMKSKDISILSSAKTQCPLHIWRLELARRCRRDSLADVFGNFDGGQGVPVAETLRDYRFSIVVENNISDYYFTEKLMNCFAAMTIPVYVGARRLDAFFNEDGIIRLSPDMSDAEIDTVLKQCTAEAYTERLTAVRENYEKVWQFAVIEDWLFANHETLLL